MNWKAIKTEGDYTKAVKRTMEIFHTEPGTVLHDELELLLILVKDYEDKHIIIPDLNPIDVIKLKMEEMGIMAKDLEPIIGSKGHVSSVLSSKREITFKMARKLKEYFNLPADIFLHSV